MSKLYKLSSEFLKKGKQQGLGGSIVYTAAQYV